MAPHDPGLGNLEPEPEIDCVDCGGRCFLLTHPREDGVWLPGDIVAYRCEDCLDRWDLVLPEPSDARGDTPDS
ncbi:MAG TPA: hypothetical protein PLV68_15300 [Ilumatobacteraceae bacterium]|nr:hypothetical protein [Ilumatobacteraceae bacterium]